ncbi:hypothetical protein M378DRAFT_172609 [Amanita muscaria Koide BX008]|uniref:Uncharacterized protein n=1 Tax=Amanita muscaria (strain Koide BX008) TaxID=946122 RepID=A0A0C2WK53_AMAMK|nr:hypothetical protein M378DRAFT_172609 [Amanita muscaria Koide BX008]
MDIGFNVITTFAHKRSQRFSKPLREEVNAFLSSDLEVSFASTMSLNSPLRDNVFSPQDNSSCIDISPLPTRP